MSRLESVDGVRPVEFTWLQEPEAPLSRLLVLLFREVCERQARLVAEWLRVGYCQGDMTSEGNSALTVVRLCHVLCHDAGNMNSDNSALCGVTLDYGPFGFVERYDKTWAMWVGSGDHFAFGNALEAARRNWATLVDALRPLAGGRGAALDAALAGWPAEARRAEGAMRAAKLGLVGAAALAAATVDGAIRWDRVAAPRVATAGGGCTSTITTVTTVTAVTAVTTVTTWRRLTGVARVPGTPRPSLQPCS